MGNANTRPDLPINWYLARDGQQHGPISDRELSELHRLGQLRSSDLLWRDGWSGWAPAAAVFRMPQLPQVPNEPSTVVGRGSTLKMAAAQALVHLLLLAALVVFPGVLVLLMYVGDWRAFAPGTGPHWWEKILYPNGHAGKCARRQFLSLSHVPSRPIPQERGAFLRHFA
jgi:hypothetical protein